MAWFDYPAADPLRRKWKKRCSKVYDFAHTVFDKCTTIRFYALYKHVEKVHIFEQPLRRIALRQVIIMDSVRYVAERFFGKMFKKEDRCQNGQGK